MAEDSRDSLAPKLIRRNQFVKHVTIEKVSIATLIRRRVDQIPVVYSVDLLKVQFDDLTPFGLVRFLNSIHHDEKCRQPALVNPVVEQFANLLQRHFTKLASDRALIGYGDAKKLVTFAVSALIGLLRRRLPAASFALARSFSAALIFAFVEMLRV